MMFDGSSAHNRRISVPAILLALCVLTLIVSLVGLYRTSSVTNARVTELNSSWQSVVDNGVSGAEMLKTDELLRNIARPVPAVQTAAGWSLAMAALTALLTLWLVLACRSPKRARSIKEADSRQDNDTSLNRMLDEVAPLASGDLDVRATATTGSVGTLAEAFNHSVAQLQRLTSLNLDTSTTLRQAAYDSQNTQAMLERQWSEQSSRLHDSSNLLSSISQVAGELSANATEAADASGLVGNQAQSVSIELKQHTGTLTDVNAGIRLSRETVETLQDYVSGISAALSTVNEVARRFDLLLLNMSLRSNDAGNNAVLSDTSLPSSVTEALSQLAHELNVEAKQISSLNRNVSTELNATFNQLNDLHSTLNGEVQQSVQLQKSLETIMSETLQLQRHALGIAERTAEQASNVKHLSENVDLINKATAKTRLDIASGIVGTDVLTSLGNDLRQSVSDLHLPENRGSSSEQSATRKARSDNKRAVING